MIPGVPYDAEIEYLESTGTQWIDTGVSAVWPGLRVELDMLLFAHSTNEVNFFGATDFGGVYFNYAGGFNSLKSFVLQLGNSYVKYGVQDASRHLHVYDSPNNRVGLDNAYVSWLTWPSLPSDTFKLFQRINKGNNAHPSHNRLWVAKFINGDTLVRDFIPVRVGQTGYMYDRVTKRLFGNKGTGSFVLGPDVAKPVMGLWGFKNLGSVDYIHNGLIAMWDGIENGGYNKHDSNAILWKDLSGNGNDLSITSGAWASDHFVCSGASGGRTGFIDGITTIEACVKRTSSSSYQMIVGLQKTSQTNNYYARYFAVSGSYVNFKSWGGKLPITLNTAECFSCVYGGQDNLFKNGVDATSYGTGDYFSAGSSDGVKLGIAGTGNYPFGGEIYSIRLYSLALSPAEIAHNYQIDKERFNLP